MELTNTLLGALGIEITDLQKGKVIATMPVDDRTRQPFTGFQYQAA
ncbi:MAG TPA: esterase, partial [Bacillus bacterium]|nr:esterase [Bacillus sp. (in: firmicutes)]